MVDRPIIFSAPMIRALLDGSKTMTRRLADRTKTIEQSGREFHMDEPGPWRDIKPGDRLWVRENFQVQQVNRICDHEGWKLHVCINYPAAEGMAFDLHRRWVWVKEADAPKILQARKDTKAGTALIGPSIHLPQIASRLTLVVTAVKVERLTAISCADAIAEGIRPAANSQTIDCDTPDPRDAFRDLWINLHGTGAWLDNPEVVALSFEVHRANIDALKVAA